jgi:hypothetical protein
MFVIGQEAFQLAAQKRDLFLMMLDPRTEFFCQDHIALVLGIPRTERIGLME